MKNVKIIHLALLISLAACASGQGLRTEMASSPEISGTYSVVLMEGTPIFGQKTRIAILDPRGDDFTIVPDARQFQTRVVRDLPADKAIETARIFVENPPTRGTADLKRIVARDGTVIGYEMRSGYTPAPYAGAAGMNVHYVAEKHGDVRVSVTLDPQLERRLAS